MYRKGGFKPVVIPATDVLPSLQSGLIDSFPNTPLACLAMQWFGLAQNMLDVPWAPLIGAIIVKKDVWESIPEKYRADIRRASRAKGLETQHLVRTQDRKAVEVMKQYGLTVNSVDAETYKKWEALAHSLHPIVREKIVSPEIFDLAVKHLNEFRSQQK
jgi:TRAP-type C4-dicarboxylate transport system substrate-binding protein